MPAASSLMSFFFLYIYINTGLGIKESRRYFWLCSQLSK